MPSSPSARNAREVACFVPKIGTETSGSHLWPSENEKADKKVEPKPGAFLKRGWGGSAEVDFCTAGRPQEQSTTYKAHGTLHLGPSALHSGHCARFVVLCSLCLGLRASRSVVKEVKAVGAIMLTPYRIRGYGSYHDHEFC